MNCPYCGHTKTRVRVTNKVMLEVQRLRSCVRCKKYFETVEVFSRKVSPEAIDELKKTYKDHLDVRQTTVHEVIEKCGSIPSKKT